MKKADKVDLMATLQDMRPARSTKRAPEAPVPAGRALPQRRASKPASRQGRVQISGHFPVAVSRQVKQIALDMGAEREDGDGQPLTVEETLKIALNMLFRSRGKPEIA